MIRRQFIAGTAAGLFAAAMSGAPSFAAENINVFAAASLKDALDAVNAAWLADSKHRATLTYAATPALARQIEQGAPADLFFSADMEWMTKLLEVNLVNPTSIVQLLGNEIVLIAPREAEVDVDLRAGADLAALLGDGKLAMADVNTVPAGKYGKAALQKLGSWSSIEAKVAQAENVRAALKLVAVGEARLGIVYATDAKAEPAVKVVAVFPADSHPPIVYPVAAVAAANNPDASAFLAYLQSDRALAIFQEKGFIILPQQAKN